MSNKKIFEDEPAMQAWLSQMLEHVDDFTDLILDQDEIYAFQPTTAIQQRMKSSYLHCLKALRANYVITKDENISLKKTDKLRPDFLIYSAEMESIVIVELKNESNATREAGTELGAYAAELKTYFPFIADGDLPCVILSSEWPTLLRHYVFHEIFWHHRNIICLEPCLKHNAPTRLRIKPIEEIIEGNEEMKFSERHFGGYHISLYSIDKLANECAQFDEQMRTALMAMASEGNRLQSHGFAFLWTDNRNLPATHAITVATLAPFKTFERLLHADEMPTGTLIEKIVKLIEEYDPSGHGASLEAISQRAIEFCAPFSSPQPEDFVTWEALKEPLLRRDTRLLAFSCWGFLEDLYLDAMFSAYSNGEHYRSFYDGDIGMRIVSKLFDPKYEFIDIASLRLFSQPDEEE